MGLFRAFVVLFVELWVSWSLSALFLKLKSRANQTDIAISLNFFICSGFQKNDPQSGLDLFPQRLIFPIGRKTHCSIVCIRKFKEKRFQSRLEMMVWMNCSQQITDNAQHEITLLVAHRISNNPLFGRFPRIYWLDAHSPVPKTGMMGANIAQIDHRMDPCFKNRIGQSELIGNCPFHKARMQVFIDLRKCPKRNEFHH